MGAFVGREAELRTIVSVVVSSRKEALARAVEIAGPSGVGKTALAQAVEAHAAKAGWLVAAVACHRIQSGLPHFLVRRLIAATIAALGDESDRYTAGLRTELDASEAGGAQSNEELFLRLLEGVTLDHPVLLSIDDVQWGDAESRSLIERTLHALANRSVVLLSTSRPDELEVSPFESRDVQVPLGELTPQASAQLARAYFSDALPGVIESIVEHAGGRAVDVVALARTALDSRATRAEDVAASMRSMIATDIGLLTKDVREFLQLCSLIAEPIELSTLQQLWPDDRALLRLIERASGRYLVQHDEALHFSHTAIAQAVRETLPIEIPFRRRIIAALETLPHPRLEDYERMAEQAAACGDRALERAYVLKLADAAERQAAYTLVATAMERALNIAPPKTAELIAFYTRLSMAYNFAGRAEEVISTLHAALKRAEFERVDQGVGPLVGSLLLALIFDGDIEEAELTHNYYDTILKDPHDRSQLVGYKALAALFNRDAARFNAITRTLSTRDNSLDPMVSLRIALSAAMLKGRCGEYEEAKRLLQEMREQFNNIPAAHAMYAVSSPLVTFQHEGPAGFERIYGPSDDSGIRPELTTILRIAIALAKEDAEDASTLLTTARVTYKDRRLNCALNGLLLNGNILLAQQALNADEAVVHEAVREFMQRSESTRLPLAAAWAASVAERDSGAATHLVDAILSRLERPLAPDVLFFPITLVIAAQRAKDTTSLSRMSDPAVFGGEGGEWNVAHRHLAALVASILIGRPPAGAAIDNCADRFTALGAPLFMRIVRGDWRKLMSGNTQHKESSVGVAINKTPTRREREVAALVAEGITNREIAERLFLSERTVEAHLANIFAKVNVHSRTQLASWFIKNFSSVAS